jgi:hypothetical protein
MSISDEKSEENNISNSNINNTEGPKNPNEQISSIVEPSTEIGRKLFHIIYYFLDGINEITRTETFINNNSHSDNTYRLNSTMNQFLSNFLIDEEDSPPLDININQESIFDIYEYDNYDILSSYFSRRFGRQLTFEEINEKINNFFTGEK